MINDDNNYTLPIHIEKEFTTDLYHTLPICVLRTHPRASEWIHENFVNIMVYPPYPCYIGVFGKFLGYFYDIFEYQTICSGIRIDSVVELIIEKLMKFNMYTYIMLDEYYLEGKSAYKTWHFNHESLIYGFDRANKTFTALTLGNNDNDIVSEITYSFDDVKTAHLAFVENVTNPDIDSIIFFKLNSETELPSFSYERYINKLTHYANGTYNNDSDFTNTTGDMTYIASYGITVQPMLAYNLLNEANMYSLYFKAIHFLYEHKVGLMNGFRYLHKNIFNNDAFDTCIQRYQEIVRKINTLRMLALKCLQLNDDRTKKRLCDGLINISREEQDILIDIIEYMKTEHTPEKILPPTPMKFHKLVELTNLSDFVSAKELDVSDNDYYRYHTVYETTWDAPLHIRHIQFNGKEKIFVSVEDEKIFATNVLTETIDQIRYIFLHKSYTKIKLDVYSNNTIRYDDLQLKAYIGSLTYQKKVTASSFFNIQGNGHMPEHAVNYGVNFWNADVGFHGEHDEEYFEVDLGGETKINRIFVQEKYDAQQIREYTVFGFDKQGNSILLAEHHGSMDGKLIEHHIDDIHICSLRLVITKTTEKESGGYAEPGILRFEAYYIPKNVSYVCIL